MAKMLGPYAPITSSTIAAGATDYSKAFYVEGCAPVSCAVQATGGTSGTVTCTFQISNDSVNWTDVTMTGTFTFTGGATTQTVTRVMLLTGAGAGTTVTAGSPAAYVRLKIVSAAAASLTNVLITWMAAG